jgi:hypothetical protein
MIVPARSAGVPAAMSAPAAITFSPGATGRYTDTASSVASVRSTITTASAPAGMTAPVETSTPVPAETASVGGCPAWTAPVSARVTGSVSVAAKVSAARTAYPSIAARSKPGTSIGAVCGAASTRPAADSSGTDVMPLGSTGSASISRCASAASISSRNSRRSLTAAPPSTRR